MAFGADLVQRVGRPAVAAREPWTKGRFPGVVFEDFWPCGFMGNSQSLAIAKGGIF